MPDAGRPKLVLAVIDGLKPSALEKAVAAGRAPVLAALMDRGTYVDDCCAAFPSVTPCCAATIATGKRQDEHRIASMNWYHREEKRYVEYGSSFGAARRVGLAKQLGDLIYRMNHEHLPADVPTVFERLDDADVRTAGTTYLFYRGRHEHQPSKESPLSRLATTVIRRPVQGPREFFYADLFASRETGCWSRMGMPGYRDQHTGCVGAYLVENDLFDFLLFSLPDNDTHSHEHGPDAQVTSIAEADRQLERLVHAAGGLDAFLADHAVIVVADHSHALVEQRIDFFEAFGDYAVLTGQRRAAQTRRDSAVPRPAQRDGLRAGLGVGPVTCCAGPAHRRDGARARRGRRRDVARLRRDRRRRTRVRRGRRRTALRARDHGAGPSRGGLDRRRGPRGARPRVRPTDGSSATAYPDALSRIWAALRCTTSGDVLLSAAPGREFPDWGGSDHVGAGSHGSLHESDSLGALVFCGVEPVADHPSRLPGGPGERWSGWSIADVTPMALAHFGLEV